MAMSTHIPYVSDRIPLSVQLVLAAVLFSAIYFVTTTLTKQRPWKNIPIASLREEGLSPKQSWFHHGNKTVMKGLQQYDAPFQVMTGGGPKIILPNRYAEELKHEKNLNFHKAVASDFFATYPGFEAFKFGGEHEGFVPEVVRVKLTQSLGLVTEDLVEETTAAVHYLFGEDAEWHDVVLKDKILHLVARLSSRVFLGKPLCRNERWLEIAKGYTVDAFIASRVLRQLPALTRPFVHWFLPHCRRIRQHYRDTQNLILPEIEMRKARAQKALDAGQKPPKVADTIGWMYELAREKREDMNYAAAQLTLTMAAIHTTTEGLTQALLDLCLRPELIQPLRDEVIQVIGEEGWTKQALYKLRLMDSFLKESQRTHPPNLLSMTRQTLTPIHLSDGTLIPANAKIMVANLYSDPATYTSPETFDAYRFLREREKDGKANTWQHVSLSSQHMAFGLGDHACPGRFFASNEIKIALAHLLVKYEWSMPEGAEDPFWMFEAATMAKTGAKVRVRRRREEVGLDL